MTAGRGASLSLRAVVREMDTVYRAPLDLPDPGGNRRPAAAVDRSTLLEACNVEGFSSAKDIAIFGAVLLTVAVNLVGQAIYAGLTAAADDRLARRPAPAAALDPDPRRCRSAA